jgi:purine-nucleoside phosphorylase
MPNTPLRSFRISDDLYNRAKMSAAENDLTVTDVIIGALEMFIDGTIDAELLKQK